MSNGMAVRITIILMIFHAISHILCEIDLRSTEDEYTPSVYDIANNINQFGTDFYKAMSKNTLRANMVCSTVSAAMVLMMAAYGTGGETLEEMNRVLHISTENTSVDVIKRKDAIHTLINHFNAVKDVRLANNIYIKSGLNVKPEFKTITDKIFRSGIKSLNFSNSEVASQEINGWCEQETNSRIKNIVQPDDFTDDTALVLVNVIYFKGIWAQKFNESDTKLRTFYRDDNTPTQVPMMHNLARYRYGELRHLSARFIELPYKTDISMSMIIILPDTIDGLQMVEEHLHEVNLTQLLTGNQYEVDVFMPKFKIKSKIDLKITLSTLGMVEMFGNKANFTGITDESPLKISKIMQKAFIEVNEEGSEAAAMTGLQVSTFSMPVQPEFRIDRPFYYAIVKRDFENDNSGLTLFQGRCVDVEESN